MPAAVRFHGRRRLFLRAGIETEHEQQGEKGKSTHAGSGGTSRPWIGPRTAMGVPAIMRGKHMNAPCRRGFDPDTGGQSRRVFALDSRMAGKAAPTESG